MDGIVDKVRGFPAKVAALPGRIAENNTLIEGSKANHINLYKNLKAYEALAKDAKDALSPIQKKHKELLELKKHCICVAIALIITVLILFILFLPFLSSLGWGLFGIAALAVFVVFPYVYYKEQFKLCDEIKAVPAPPATPVGSHRSGSPAPPALATPVGSHRSGSPAPRRSPGRSSVRSDGST